MPKRATPNIDELKQLYDAAVEFKKAKCWEWMYDSDIFGIVDPESHETGYCCIMGNAGEHFAIAAYLGWEGFDSITRLMSGEIDPGDPDNMFIQKCLMCSFEDRSDLHPEDLKIIKSLGLKFRGRNEWPVFRHYEPGFFPWFLTAQQCRFLTHVITQALDISLKHRNKELTLHNPNPYLILIRKSAPGKDCELIWEDTYKTVEPPANKFVSFQITDEMCIKRIKSMKCKKNYSLEIDTFFVPAPIKDKKRPYYPKACVILDHMNGTIISFELLKNINNEGFKCIEALIKYIESSRILPSRILVCREETFHIYEEACRQFDIKLELVDSLDFIEEARLSMFDFFDDL